MIKKFFRHNAWLVLLSDLVLIVASYLFANFTRFDFNFTILKLNVSKLYISLGIIVCVKIFFIYYFDLYLGMWRYTGIKDLINILKAAISSFFVILFIFMFLLRLHTFSRSVLLIDLILTIIGLGSNRILIRIYFDYFLKSSSNGFEEQTNVLIIGAGDAGERLFREVDRDKEKNYKVVGFVDDQISKIGKKIHGIEVLSNITNLQTAIKETRAKIVMIAIPSASDEQMKKIVNICKNNDVDFKTIPTMNEIINNRISINQLRDVSYKDILGRDEIVFDKKEIVDYLKRKTILVTGSAGSIGSELCRQIARFEPSRIILFDIAETPLYHIENNMKELFPYLPIKPIIGDIKDTNHLEILFKRYKPDIIFHAAAYKHVPMMEEQPWKAVENNLFGTKALVEAAKQFSVGQFILISTDKAVNPTSIMGASKKLAEILIHNQDSSKTMFSCVRFGNVLGSAGSVIPLFEKQIKEGKPLTITHPEVKRYFMTIPEACLLVIQAGSLSLGGEIFILEMGKMRKIVDIAKNMINFYSYKTNKNLDIIKFIGLRKGEKLYEELSTSDEKLIETNHTKIKKIDNCIKRVFSEKDIIALKKAVNNQDRFEVIKTVKNIVPEYNMEI